MKAHQNIVRDNFMSHFCSFMHTRTMSCHVFLLAVDYSSIHHLLELTEGETDLDSDKDIPDIFSKVSHIHTLSHHSTIMIIMTQNINYAHPICMIQPYV